MVVRVNGGLAAARAVQLLVGVAGDHLVDVHVGLGAGPRLPDHQGELVVEPSGGDRPGGVLDRGDDPGIQPVLAVHPRGRLLDEGLGVDDADRHALGRAEREIVDRALGLRAPIAVRRHLDRADGIRFGPGLAGAHLHLLNSPLPLTSCG
jgi:hypothetical protein